MEQHRGALLLKFYASETYGLWKDLRSCLLDVDLALAAVQVVALQVYQEVLRALSFGFGDFIAEASSACCVSVGTQVISAVRLDVRLLNAQKPPNLLPGFNRNSLGQVDADGALCSCCYWWCFSLFSHVNCL